MPAPRQSQNGAMLYTVITFVSLFVIATVIAVLYYIDAEDTRLQLESSDLQLEKLVSPKESRDIIGLIGETEGRKSRLGQILGYIDQTYKMFTGLESNEISAKEKFSIVEMKFTETLANIPEEMIANSEPNSPGVFRIIQMYKNELKTTEDVASELGNQLDEMYSESEQVRQAISIKEKDLLEQIRSEQQRADKAQKSYDDLKALMEQKTAEQITTLTNRNDGLMEEGSKTKQELLATLAKLNLTQDRLKQALARLEAIKPRPNEEVDAYRSDGQILSIETSSNIVFLNIGAEDKVYPGLTFSVYDRNAPIPVDGKGKAEVEVFDVDKTTSVARIVKSSMKNPIVIGDLVVNLIWDSKATNTFIVAGDFDFNNNGKIDADAPKKIRQLIENWGGKVDREVTINTDFVILGTSPKIPDKPSLDDIEIDPMAMDKYEASIRAVADYQDVKKQAESLYIPIFNLKRFLNFIGYETIAGKS